MSHKLEIEKVGPGRKRGMQAAIGFAADRGALGMIGEDSEATETELGGSPLSKHIIGKYVYSPDQGRFLSCAIIIHSLSRYSKISNLSRIATMILSSCVVKSYI